MKAKKKPFKSKSVEPQTPRIEVDAKNRGEFEQLEEKIVDQIENIQKKVTIMDLIKARLEKLVAMQADLNQDSSSDGEITDSQEGSRQNVISSYHKKSI